MLTALAALILAGLVVVFIAYPLVRGEAEGDVSVGTLERWNVERANVPVEDLLFEHEANLKTLRDLDFDYQMGRLSEVDYRELRARYAAQGVAVLQRLDEATLEAPASEIEDEIEQEVRRLRDTHLADPAIVPDGHISAADTASPDVLEDEIEREIQQLRRREPERVGATHAPMPATAPAREPAPVRPAGRSGTCPDCGHRVEAADKFCPACGTSLVARRCPACGTVAAPQDRFCARCGTAIRAR